MTLTVVGSPAELAIKGARRFAAAAASAIQARGSFSVALSGGSTPRATYETLGSPQFRDAISWEPVHVFWSDERCVPPDHPDSNFRMARLALLDRVPLPPENIHRIDGELPPEEAARRYESELADGGVPRRFDLVLLGLGPDGHTASLFPDAVPPPAGRLAAAVYAPHLDSWRVTLTPAAINGAEQVLFLVEGGEKAEALAATLRGPQDPARWPAQAIRGASGEAEWLVDEAAAALLPRPIS